MCQARDLRSAAVEKDARPRRRLTVRLYQLAFNRAKHEKPEQSRQGVLSRLLGRIDARKNPMFSLRRRSRPQRSVGNLGARIVQDAAARSSSVPTPIVPVGRAVPGVASIGSVNELTKEWLTSAFRYRGYLGPGGEVTSVKLRPLTEGLGALGDLLKVEVTLSGALPGAPTNFVAKFAPQGRTPIPRFLVRHTFMSETHFYFDFDVEQGGLPRPECYFALADASRRKLTFCLLIEDMAPARCVSRTAGCDDMDSLTSVMASLARLHARWWGHPKSAPLEWAPHPSDFAGAVGHVWRYLERAGLKALPACFGETYAPILDWAPLVLRRQRKIFRELFAEPLTLCHGDAHLDNIFFHERFSDGCALVDFGNMMFGQGLSDVAFFLATNVSVETRRQHENTVLRFYHMRLIEGGVDPDAYPFERCLRDYRFQLWRPFVALLTLTPGFARQKRLREGMFASSPSEADERLLTMYLQFNQRLVAALLDHKWIDLLLEPQPKDTAAPRAELALYSCIL
uniref:CHK kinase-like domain-containing protein n=1 Tax=Prymnesium polylepis TaxID=72548 RepID=A0A7S4HEQ4_9EUKA|mmetsp:Transcript_14128/g.35909  ORF Transcript_14128/g.35909 Transcript_14128/m.35909 type:complete len:512 (+) Transcript_14128:101-1636(+)